MSKLRGPGKWRPESPARTNTGMSIRGKPISNPVLLAEDDEFPIRTPGASIATPLGAEAIVRNSGTSRRGSKTLSEHIASIDFAQSSKTERPVPSSQRPRTPPSPPRARPEPAESPIPSKSSGTGGGEPQRKKSTLRSVFGRLFGKKQRHHPGPRGPDGSAQRHGQHNSDPTALKSSTKLSAQRSASLPINEYNRALRSHSVTTEDFPLSEEAEKEASSTQGEGYTRPRRATTPSRLWTPNRGDYMGLSPRPASSHARGSKVVSDEEAEPHIGVALTAGSHPNRRSRSVGELREVTQGKLVIRRRSDEIKYWRESYDPGLLSPISSNHKADEVEDPILVDSPQEAAPKPFNFGPMGELAGMKITQAASLETRVQRLESRMQDLEREVVRLRASASLEALFPEPPRRNSLRTRSASATGPRTAASDPPMSISTSFPQPAQYRGVDQPRSSSYGGSRPSTTSTSNSYFPPQGEGEFSSPLQEQPTPRPLSMSTTIRGAPSTSPTASKDGALTAEHYTTLTNMIYAEQSARQALEATVNALQKQVQKLSQRAHTVPPPTTSTTTRAEREQFSGFEQDDSSEDEAGDGDDGERYEDFRTPNEEGARFGEEDFGGGEGDEKMATRTMSLSQMTLGRGAQAGMNF